METCRSGKPTINIFEILHLRKERYHNAMLAWLLDPEQSHGLDDAFLSRFLERVGVKNYTRDDFQKIQPQYTLATRRPDIFIETRTYKIYVENKVFASSIDNQELKDQARDIRDDARDKEFVHVLIVPRRSDIKSSTRAVVREHDICTLEWSELVKLLDDIGGKDDADRHVRAILEQYLYYMRKIGDMFDGFNIKEMQKYVEAAEVMWRFEKGESPTKRQIEGFLAIVAEEVLSRLSGIVSSEWDFQIKQSSSLPVNWEAYFTSDERYSGIEFYIGIWYGPPQYHPADGLLRASVGVRLYGERIAQLTEIVHNKSCEFTGQDTKGYTNDNVHEYEEYFDKVQWSALEQWPSFRDRLVERAVVWMTELIPVIEERLQQLQKGRRAKKRAPAPR